MPESLFALAVKTADAVRKGKIHLEHIHGFIFRADKVWAQPAQRVVKASGLIVDHRPGGESRP